MSNLTKSELIDAIATKSGATKKVTGEVVDALGAVLSGLLKTGHGGDTANTGFGKFKVVERPARKGRNPATGAEIQIAASKTLSFKASSSL
jgi:DNA-binding protein HU-beta